MRILRTSRAMRAASRRLRAAGRRIAFVPTMGALHAGHASLLRLARRHGDRVVLSIFVNPLQFGPREDFARYPRPLGLDLAVARRERVDLVYLPPVAAMYPPGFQTRIQVPELAARWCGAARPGHFDGVCTVVTKLLHHVEPHVLLLGQKDAQQAVIIARLIGDLDLDVELVVGPTVRESDGLAMSSRNAYLTARERAQAPAIYAALRAGVAAIRAGERRTRVVQRIIAAHLARALLIRPEYVALVDTAHLVEHDRLPSEVLALVAVRLGRARLIDNVFIHGGNSRRARGASRRIQLKPSG